MSSALDPPVRRHAGAAPRIAAAVARARAMAGRSPVAALRLTLGMPRSRFARLVGRTERAISDWESGKARPQGLSEQRVRELGRLTEAIRELFGVPALGAWFEAPNPAFGGLKPVEVIERGESDRLWQMVFRLRSGMHV